MPHKNLLSLLNTHEITYEVHTHVPIFTAEEAHKLQLDIKGAHSKNLFLRDKARNFFLVTVLDHKRVDLKTLSKNHGAGHFSFGNEEDLKTLLGVTRGSVTPYGLVNDNERKVQFLLDKDILDHDFVNFHPLRNDMTINMGSNDFLRFFEKLGRTPEIISIPTV
jgi:Ala-tRNA(Pro) deacylase